MPPGRKAPVDTAIATGTVVAVLAPAVRRCAPSRCPVTAALWCPSTRVTGAGPGQHHHRRLRQRRAATVIRRLSLLGTHALAISRDHRAATTAGTRTAAPTAAHTGLGLSTPINVDHRSPLPALAAIPATVARRLSSAASARARAEPSDSPASDRPAR